MTKNTPQKKSNIGLIAAFAVLVVVASGTMAFLSQNAEKATEESEEKTAQVLAADHQAQIESAAGDNQGQKQGNATNQSVVDTLEPGNPVVAKVDGEDITRVDVYRYIKSMPQSVQQLPAQQIYPLALEQVVIRALFK